MHISNSLALSYKCVILLFIMVSTAFRFEPLTQTIKGKILDGDTQTPLIGVTVLLNVEPLKGAITNVDGNFKIEKVPLGRHDLQISYIGYESIRIDQILVTAKKEVVLTINLRQSITNLEGVTVIANEQDKYESLNDMATVSVRKFTSEETGRYAGGFSDPARAVSSFAGVSISSDNSNEIVIRGNTPKGLLWRLEGVEIPNPNHFSTGNGSAGGGVSILSNDVLANSDFFTSAFPAEYGNALSGVFDLGIRNGNSKREYTAQLGFLGGQILLEGPFSKKSESSYLLNYRYSTLGLINKLGIVVGNNTTIIPEYQDINFKINLPTKKAGRFSLFGIGGLSNAGTQSIKDSTQWSSFLDKQERTQSGKTGVLGLSHVYLINKNTYLKTVLSYSINHNTVNYDSLDNFYNPQNFFLENYGNSSTIFSTLINHKFNAKHVLRAGFIYNNLSSSIKIMGLNLQDRIKQNTDQYLNAHFIHSYIQWKFRVLENLEINTGLHHNSFLFNNNHALEPRFGIKWLHDNHVFSYGLGLHSRLEPLFVYMTNLKSISSTANFVYEGGDSFLFSPNDVLRLSQSVHNVLSHDWRFAKDFHLKTEIYYQELFNIPVENKEGSTLSTLNLNSYDHSFSNINLVNKGRGYNYGLEFTLEKFFSNSYYLLLTASFFESKYKGLDNIIRNTRFNKNYVYNIAIGKEFYTGKTKQNIIDLNVKMVWSGGNRFIPIDLEQSKIQNQEILHLDRAFRNRLPDYFRIDFKANYRFNRPRYTLITSIDIQNVINRPNIENRFYNIEDQKIEIIKSLGIIPVLNFKVEF